MELYITQYLADAILAALLNGTPFPVPTEVWVALFEDGSPGEYDEVSQPWYERKEVNVDLYSDPHWTAPDDHPEVDARYSGNSAEIAYLEAGSGEDADVTAVGLVDESGNVLMAGVLTSTQEVREGRTFRFRQDDLKVAFDRTTNVFNLSES